MSQWPRRKFLQGSALGLTALQGTHALPTPTTPQRTGTIEDVAHVVILTQENRAFDHYFGALRGVRGFADRFPIPLAPSHHASPRNVWQQLDQQGRVVRPYRLNTRTHPHYMRAEGTPHTWPDAQQAWQHGRLDGWVAAKGAHSLTHFGRDDLPFHYALADAFTVCDAYHCSFMGGTNPNRLFLWSGTNDPLALGNGPALYNELDGPTAAADLPAYQWTTYAERLQQAGVSWQIYQDMADNYSDNPLVGFAAFRRAQQSNDTAAQALRERALSTRALDDLQADVLADRLPSVSWIVAPAADSEHPEPSSPAQGAAFTAQLLRALWSNPKVWQRTVLLWNYDENDGYFDHMPPPAVPSRDPVSGKLCGASGVDTTGEYHCHIQPYHRDPREATLLERPYGLGPRVPMIIVSPWSRGGWVCSQVFDHTSVLRFLERRFGVVEPNISPWRRAVCGDLTAAFDFARPDDSLPDLPDTDAAAARSRQFAQRTLVHPPRAAVQPRQEAGVRPSRPTPYALRVQAQVAPDGVVTLRFTNDGACAAVLHVYDRDQPETMPRRYSVDVGQTLADQWGTPGRHYDLWILGPNGFHRHVAGRRLPHGLQPPEVSQDRSDGDPRLHLRLHNPGTQAVTLELRPLAYASQPRRRVPLAAGQTTALDWPVADSAGWYDLLLTSPQWLGYQRRLAGRLEGPWATLSDPAMGQIDR